ncbi:glycosyltransferase family 2 protein [Actinomadura sp. KC06]|uniref:glycosyltransferase family 2 protein n=1 Tax=Actinomadura sp. KC06 TaxID=2530369 RepID=UPI00104415D5|nr:glycosyltransferase [Actinomadura sp. KC06]TDD37827.1 glycosyltransferase family 2 protein [Actinomadura sp. KC06]
MKIYEARRARGRLITVMLGLLVAAVGWSIHHAMVTMQALNGDTRKFGMVYSLSAAMLVFQLVLAHAERPFTVTRRQQRHLDSLNLAVLVPAYNEDPELLVRCLMSLGNQTRRPDHILVVDDGSDKVDLSAVRAWFLAEGARTGLRTSWVRTPNRGKRQAHGTAISMAPDADAFLTVDSDAILDREAVAEGLKPLARKDVQAVAGVVLAANNRTTLLARFTDLWYVTSQLIDRSSLSAMGSVLVNSGPLAFYRAETVRQYLDTYLNETLAGREVRFSDDSMLTLFAKLEGRTVQQPSSFVFTAMPEKVGNHFRQYTRWMRGSTVRSLWRFRYLPVTSLAYWLHFSRWVSMAVSTMLFAALFLVQPVVDGALTLSLLAMTVLIGYAQCLRYLTVWRSDQSVCSQWATWMLAPLAALWAYFILRPVRWYAMATCLRTGWGTRAEVEVTLGGAS